jgi:hypothetical protein
MSDRTKEVSEVWARLDSFRVIESGWYNGEGEVIDNRAIDSAKYILAQLLLDYPELPRPYTYPTIVGGVQAEWILKDSWAVDAEFSPEGYTLGLNALEFHKREDRNYTYTIEKDKLHLVGHKVGFWISGLVK